MNVALGLLAYIVCNTIWFIGEAKMIRCLTLGQTWEGVLCGGIGGLISMPLCLVGAWLLYKAHGSWIVTQAPSIVVSYCAFRGIVGSKIGWREIVDMTMVAAATIVMSIKTEGECVSGN